MKIIVAVALFIYFTNFTYSQTNDPNIWMTDGAVNAITQTGNTIYIGGNFDYVGRYTGQGTMINIATGELTSQCPKLIMR